MNNQIQLEPISQCELSSTAAIFQDSLSFEQWTHAGHQLCKMAACSLWWIGDWLIFGLDKYGDKSRLAREHAEECGLSEDTIRAAIHVSNMVAPVRRRTTLSWNHHREVMGLKAIDQDKWLAKAEKGNKGKRWSVAELRAAIRQSDSEFADDEPNPKLFAWVKAADDLARMLKTAMNDAPVETWPAERREATKEQLRPIHEVYESL